MKKYEVLIFAVLLSFSNVTAAATVFLDSMSIIVDNQESTVSNTFNGNQIFSNSLIIPNNASVDYFLVELINNTTIPGIPQNTVLEYIDTSRPSNNTHVERMTFFGDGSNIILGETLIADGKTYFKDGTNVVISTSGMYDIFSTFVNGNGPQSPWISINTTSFYSAIDSPYIGLEFKVSAYGQVSYVPVPPALWLFISGFVYLFGVNKLRKA